MSKPFQSRDDGQCNGPLRSQRQRRDARMTMPIRTASALARQIPGADNVSLYVNQANALHAVDCGVRPLNAAREAPPGWGA